MLGITGQWRTIDCEDADAILIDKVEGKGSAEEYRKGIAAMRRMYRESGPRTRSGWRHRMTVPLSVALAHEREKPGCWKDKRFLAEQEKVWGVLPKGSTGWFSGAGLAPSCKPSTSTSDRSTGVLIESTTSLTRPGPFLTDGSAPSQQATSSSTSPTTSKEAPSTDS